MRKTIFMKASAAIVALSLTLGGCSSTGALVNPFTGTPITAASVAAAAEAACGFLPTATSIAAILTAEPAIATAEAVAGIICGAVTAAPAGTQSARLRAPGPVTVSAVVNGQAVNISGSFVQGGRYRHRPLE